MVRLDFAVPAGSPYTYTHDNEALMRRAETMNYALFIWSPRQKMPCQHASSIKVKLFDFDSAVMLLKFRH